MILNKVTDCYLTGKDGEREEIQDDKLYHVVTDCTQAVCWDLFWTNPMV